MRRWRRGCWRSSSTRATTRRRRPTAPPRGDPHTSAPTRDRAATRAARSPRCGRRAFTGRRWQPSLGVPRLAAATRGRAPATGRGGLAIQVAWMAGYPPTIHPPTRLSLDPAAVSSLSGEDGRGAGLPPSDCPLPWPALGRLPTTVKSRVKKWTEGCHRPCGCETITGRGQGLWTPDTSLEEEQKKWRVPCSGLFPAVCHHCCRHMLFASARCLVDNL